MKKVVFLFFCFLIFCKPDVSAMGWWMPDVLIYKGDTLKLFAHPLNGNPYESNYFGREDNFRADYTACWTIENDSLFLLNIRDLLYTRERNKFISKDSIGSEYANLAMLFPGKYKNGKVFADWVTDEMIVPLGKMVYVVNDGFASSYEKEKEFVVENGLLKEIREYDNSASKDLVFEDKNYSDYLYTHIDWNLVPDLDSSKVIVSVRYSANIEGVIDDVSVRRSRGEPFDSIALNVIKSIPLWSVQVKKGKLYRHWYNMAIHFSEKQRKKYATMEKVLFTPQIRVVD